MDNDNLIEIEAVNHICLVVKNLHTAKEFYSGILGMKEHPKVDSWLEICKGTYLHLVNIPEAEADNSLFHEIQHFAMQVKDLKIVNQTLFRFNLKPFQMDFNGNVKDILNSDDLLNFGIGTIFVPDPDGNLVEFIQIDTGIFLEKAI